MGRKRFAHYRVGMLTMIVVSILVCSINIAALQTRTSFAQVRQSTPLNTTMLTYKNDVSRTGLNPNETILTTANVNVSQFGKRISYSVDGQVYAQPLYVPNLTMGSSTHNVVFVATEHDSVYAFDADQASFSRSSNFLWHTSFINPPNVTTVSSTDVNCTDLVPEIGITSTPVIDPATNAIYVVATTKENGAIVYRLHALDTATGNEKPGSPTLIQASVAGTGAGSVNGQVPFTPKQERQRAALLFVNGTIYIGWAGYCDNPPYHGWVMGYTYNGSTFQQVYVYNSTPNGYDGGIWQSGGGLAADSSGNIYAMSGNGEFDLNNTGSVDAGDTFLKWNAQLQLTDYFTPFNQSCLDSGDVDLGSSGPLLLPSQSGSTPNELIGMGKEGRIYVVNRDDMGKFTTDPSLNCQTSEQNRTDIDKVVQELPPHTANTGVWGTTAYWNGPSGQYFYVAGVPDHLKAFSVTNGMLSTSAKSQSPESFGFPSTDPVVSSNGTIVGTAIVWAIDPNAVLRAYDASNLSTELYNSAQNTGRDGLDSYVKFTVPTVANGEVFVGTKATLTIFGELPTPAPNNIGTSNDSNPSAANYDHGGYSYSAQALQQTGITPGASVPFSGVNFTWPNVAPGSADNYQASGQIIPITPVSGATTLAFLGSSTNGSASGTATITYTDATTQTFSLGFTDWANASTSFGNSIVATMSYRNCSCGKQNTSVYIFYTEVAMQAGKTLKSVTLPSSVSGGQLHVFTTGTRVSSTPPPVSYNNVGTSQDSNPSAANYDGGGNSYSSQALQGVAIKPGGSVTFNKVTFNWPNVATGSADNYRAAGQTIPVTPVSSASTLAFLGSSTNGPSTGTAIINYSDGSTQSFSLGFSDWTLNAGKSTPSYGNGVAAVTSYRNTSTGKQTINTYIFYAAVTLQSGKTVNSVRLPSSLNQGQLHVFSIATATAAGPVGYNNIGTSDDSNPTAANYDHGGYSYSAQALQTAGIKPGGYVISNGVTFLWPSPTSGVANNYQASGQTISVTQAAGRSRLAFLGSATSGASSGTITITYTDGTTQTVTLGFSDWAVGSTSFGNSIVVKMPYRNGTHGKQSINVYVFYADVALQSGKIVQSVTLPSSVSGGQLHVFSVGTK
jgi:hypothetical protein